MVNLTQPLFNKPLYLITLTCSNYLLYFAHLLTNDVYKHHETDVARCTLKNSISY